MMDIRSRAESLRPFRYLLSRQRDQDEELAASWPGLDDDPENPNALRWRQAAAPQGGSLAGAAQIAAAPIAIVGMGCRFPDADDPAALLDLVLTGRRAFRRLPPGRLDLADYYSADRAAPDMTYSARAALLEGWQFDLAAFGVPGPVYQAADPAQWLALETTARALAAAGFALGQGLARSRTGVIIGNTLTGDWSRATALRLRWPYVRRVLTEALVAGDIPQERAVPVLRHAAQRYLAPFPPTTDETLAGGAPAAIASRICGFFGFRGGGYAVDGAQASSLLAVASACTALAAGDLDVALAGGVDISLDPLELVGLAKTGALARGEVRVYDENPTGFLPGEGCGMVVLMRSADARLAGLPVYAEIAGWGTAAAGQASVSVPDAHSQFLAMHRAYQRARIAPTDIQFIEGHGAGTAAADATELSALAELRAGAQQVAALGSIKANIGNTKAAAGVAGLIKTVLAMSTGYIPPATGFNRPHPVLRSGQAALRLPREPEPWPDGPRLAGVSAMGPGIDVHLVLRAEPSRGRHERRARSAAPAWRQAGETQQVAPLPHIGGLARSTAYLLHAPNRSALDALLARIARVGPWLSDAELGDLACHLARDTAPQGPARMAIVASNQDQLARLASQGTAMLAGLTGGALTARPGIYAADGADGHVTLLFSDIRPGDRPDDPEAPDGWLRPLPALRWLGQIGVRASAGVGYGLGELAGLVWAGCLGEEEAIAFAASRMSVLNAAAEPAWLPRAEPDATSAPTRDRAAVVRAALSRLTVANPVQRLISAAIGRGVGSAADVPEILLADLDCSPGLDRALKTGATGASLLLETGPGRGLSQAASVLCDVPAVSLGSGSGADVARVAAALFAVGALGRPAELFAGRPSRPIDIWREHTFITNPCQIVPAPAQLIPRPAPQGDARAAAPAAAKAAAKPAAAARSATEPAAKARAGAVNPSEAPSAPEGPAAAKPSGARTARRADAGSAALARAEGPARVELPGQATTEAAGPAGTETPSQARTEPAGHGAPAAQHGASARTQDEKPARAEVPGQARVAGQGARAPQHAAGPNGGTPSAPASLAEAAAVAERAAANLAAAVLRGGGAKQKAAARHAAERAQAGGTPARRAAARKHAAPAGPAAAAEQPAQAETTVTPGVTAPRPRAASTAETATPASTAKPAEGNAPVQASVPGAGDSLGESGAAGRPVAPSRPQELAEDFASPERDAPSEGVAPGEPVASADAEYPAGVGPWVHCFAEGLRTAGSAAAADDDQAWRVRAATKPALGPLVQKLFADDPAADQVLAIVDDPANSDSCVVALAAARDAISRGRLIVVTHGAGLTGFCASLHAEHPELGITVLRVPESADGLRAARQYATAEPGTFREFVIDTTGQAHETVMALAEPEDSGTEFPLGPDDVVLISRGATGAGLALAQVLACCGAPLALVGREARGEVAEVAAGLERLESAGVRMSVEPVDVANAADLHRALERIERRLGPVTAVAHAVGVAGSRPIADLTEEELRGHIGAETARLHHMVSALPTARLRLIITFGSVAGRYGLAGEGLLALASGSLADRAERTSDGIPGCDALHVDWPAWSGQGLGQRASLAQRLERSGATPIGVTEGSRLLLKTLSTRERPTRVAVHGRVGVPAPPAIAAAWPRDRVARGRFLQEIRVHYPGVELVCDARLTPGADPYLADYQVDGTTALPAVMALEAMAEAATVLSGRPMRRLTGVSMQAPVVVPAAAEGPALIRICALRDGASVTTVIRCAESGFATDHFRATFHIPDEAADAATPSLAAGLPDLDEMPASHTGIVDGTELYGPICFQSGRFRRAALLPEVTARSCRALVRGEDGEPWFGAMASQAGVSLAPGGSVLTGPVPDDLVLGSPGLNDATWHVLQACVPHRRLLPAGCESVTFSGQEADGAVEIRAVEVRRDLAGAVPGPRSGTPADAAPADAEYVWDVEAIDSAGQPLVTWRGLRLADAGPLPRAAAWPPSLLSVYLERSAAALGLHPDLQVTVRFGAPESTGPQPAVVVPAPRHAAERRPTVPGDPAGEQTTRGRGLLDGFVLSVRSPHGAACGWEVAAAGAGQGPEPGPGLAGVESVLRADRGEPPAVVEAVLRAVTGCLAMTGAPEAAPAVAGAADGGWLLLRTGQATLACTVVEISGVSSPVAIAVMTGDPAQQDEPDAAMSPAISTPSRPMTARGPGTHARPADPDGSEL
jgi:enediyne polyketide synthase